MKRAFFILTVFASLLISCSSGDNASGAGKYDTKAIDQLDKLSEVIGQLSSCSYTLNTSDHVNFDSTVHNEHDVYLRGPNKMFVHTVGRRGESDYRYDGKKLAFYSYDKNQYDTLIAESDIMTTIEYVMSNYEVDFPGLGFFYSSLTDDLIAANSSILYQGEVNADSTEYVELLVANEKRSLRIWIEKTTNLPYAIRSESVSDKDVLYEAVFSNWRIDPELPDIMFEFEPPSGSTRVNIPTKN